MSEVAPYKCELAPQCKVAEPDGRCMDGITPVTECKHLITATNPGKAPQDTAVTAGTNGRDDTDDEIATVEFDPEMHVHLPSGLELSVTDASAVLNREGGTVVAFIGFRETGKTSLFSSLYNLFQSGPIDGLLFAGSDTLVAFEERCHDTRLASGREIPVTPRSEKTGIHYLHLRVVDTKAGDKENTFIFADRSGEYFKDATNDTSVCAQFIELQRADVIVLLVDGEKLLKRDERPVVLANCGALVQTLIDNGKLTPKDRINVVLSKIDSIKSAPEADMKITEATYASFKKTFGTRFAGKLGEISFWEVAACPKSGGLKVGTGIEPLLRNWKPNEAKYLVPSSGTAATASVLDIDKFEERYFRPARAAEVAR